MKGQIVSDGILKGKEKNDTYLQNTFNLPTAKLFYSNFSQSANNQHVHKSMMQQGRTVRQHEAM